MAYYDFDAILTRMLARVSATRDKRQGSVIYDTLAPTAAELAQANIMATIFENQVSILTAVGTNLENLGANYGITRNQATRAIRIGETFDQNGNPIDVSVGSRFSIPAIDGGYNFAVVKNLDTAGQCLMECETGGTAGNAYLGNILPLFTVNNLGSAAIIGIDTPAEDTETDDELRTRILARINNQAFGGNVAYYKQFIKAISGVGDVKVFPVWSGGGTVKLSIIDGSYNVATPEFVSNVQNEVDPIEHTGEGLGIAPIGHRITVVTPVELFIDITATVNLETGYTLGQVRSLIDDAISNYILEVRKQWADAGSISIFVARIIAAAVGIAGVNNITDITINGIAGDLVLTQSASVQQLPFFGSAVISGA